MNRIEKSGNGGKAAAGVDSCARTEVAVDSWYGAVLRTRRKGSVATHCVAVTGKVRAVTGTGTVVFRLDPSAGSLWTACLSCGKD